MLKLTKIVIRLVVYSLMNFRFLNGLNKVLVV